MHSFEDMTIWIFFVDFALKCLFTPPKFCFFGVGMPKRDWSSSRPLKGTSFAETACTYMPILVEIGPLVRPGRVLKESKKARKETYSGKLGVRPDHPHWRSDMWSCMPGGLREIVLSFKFRQNRLNGFRDLGGGVKICHFLYLRPVAYITACTTVKPWCTYEYIMPTFAEVKMWQTSRVTTGDMSHFLTHWCGVNMVDLVDVIRSFIPSNINALCVKFNVAFGDKTRWSFCTSLIASVIGAKSFSDCRDTQISNASSSSSSCWQERMLFDVSASTVDVVVIT